MGLGKPHRFEALDSLRGVSACMIVLLHLDTIGFINRSSLVQHGFLFVDFFFVLSGFVISASYGNRLAHDFPITDFMKLRLGRIYPLHFVVLALFVIFEAATAGITRHSGNLPFSEIHSPGMLLANLGLIQTFVGPDRSSWNGPAWSIAVEVWTYLLFAFLFRHSSRFIVPVAFLLAAGCGFYLLFATDRFLDAYHDGAFARCLIGFSFGIITFHLFSKVQWRVSNLQASITEILVVMATVVMIIIAGSTLISLLFPILFAVVIFIFSHQSGSVSKFLLIRPMKFIGKISYSIYLIHFFIISRMINILELSQGHMRDYHLIYYVGSKKFVGQTPLMADLISVIVLVLVILLAAMSYSFIENPANRWVRRKVQSARSGSQPHSAPAAGEALDNAGQIPTRMYEPI